MALTCSQPLQGSSSHSLWKVESLQRPARPTWSAPVISLTSSPAALPHVLSAPAQRSTSSSLNMVAQSYLRAFSCAVSSAGRVFPQRDTWLTLISFRSLLKGTLSVGPYPTNFAKRTNTFTVDSLCPSPPILFNRALIITWLCIYGNLSSLHVFSQ